MIWSEQFCIFSVDSLVVHSTICSGDLGQPETLWVVFGDWATAFQKHWFNSITFCIDNWISLVRMYDLIFYFSLGKLLGCADYVHHHSSAHKGQAPVPLSIFWSNTKFDENSKHSSAKYTRPITTIFCTRHDSVTVVTCAKYRCDRSNIFETRAFWIFIEFRIRSKYA